MIEKISKGKMSKFLDDNSLESNLDNGPQKSLRYIERKLINKAA